LAGAKRLDNKPAPCVRIWENTPFDFGFVGGWKSDFGCDDVDTEIEELPD